MNKEFTLCMTTMQPICHLTDRESLLELSKDEQYIAARKELGRKEGTLKLINKQLVLTKDGIKEVPVISGNAIRGIWRRLAARELLELLEIETIPKKLKYLLYVGGGLSEKGKGNPLKEFEFKNKLRKNIPMLSLFGCSIGTGMLEGKLKTGFVYPVVKETYRILGLEEVDDETISAKDIIGEAMGTRLDNIDLTKEEYEKEKSSVQMIYHHQYMAPGVKLMQDITILKPNDIEVSCFISILEKFKEYPYIGGMISKGFGRVKIDKMPEESSEQYIDYIKENKQDIKKYLLSLNEEL